MKLIRFGAIDNEKPGIHIDGINYDVSAFVNDYDEHFFANDGIQDLSNQLVEKNLPAIPESSRIAAPIARPSKIICVGLNYAKHAMETNADIPKEPIIFLKATTSHSGPFDNIIIPKNSVKTDWEVELAIVIEKKPTMLKLMKRWIM